MLSITRRFKKKYIAAPMTKPTLLPYNKLLEKLVLIANDQHMPITAPKKEVNNAVRTII